MTDRDLPSLPPLPDDEQATAEEVAPALPGAATGRSAAGSAEHEPPSRERRPRRPERQATVRGPHEDRPGRRRTRPDEERRLWSAGHALVVMALALGISLLLNAPGAHKKAYNLSDGWQRDAALAVTGPLDAISGALLLDGPRRLVQAAIGRSGEDRIDRAVALPDVTLQPVAGRPKPSPGSGQPAPATPARRRFTPERKLRLWVAGDSLVITPGWSIVRASGASPVIESVGGVDGHIATGLTRPDVFNWFEEIRAQVRKLRPAAVVLCFGGNDDKAYMTGLPKGVGIGAFGDAAWRREYARRAGGVMDMIARAGAHVIWIGLPQTRDTAQTQRFDVVNSVVAREARKRPSTVTFLDTYTMFASDTGGYTQYLRGATGSEQKVRADDGVHFERAGGDLIAREVLRTLNSVYDLTSWKHAQGTS